jgi:hypothetical protein
MFDKYTTTDALLYKYTQTRTHRHSEQITREGHVSVASEFFTDKWGLHDEFYILIFDRSWWIESTDGFLGRDRMVHCCSAVGKWIHLGLVHLGVKSVGSPMNVLEIKLQQPMRMREQGAMRGIRSKGWVLEYLGVSHVRIPWTIILYSLVILSLLAMKERESERDLLVFVRLCM